MATKLTISEERDYLLEVFEQCIKDDDISLLTEASSTISGSDLEKKTKLDEASQGYALYRWDNNFGVDQIKPMMEIMIQAISKDLMNSSTIFGMYQDLFDINTLDDCEQIFYLLEGHIDIFKQDEFYIRGKTSLLRTVNDLLKRASNTENLRFTHRMQCFLARLYPISEKSGLNMMGVFNVNNVTEYKSTKESYCIGHLLSHIESDEEMITDSEDDSNYISPSTIENIELESKELRNFASLVMPSPDDIKTSDFINGIKAAENLATINKDSMTTQQFDETMAPSCGVGNETIVVKGISRKVFVRGWNDEYSNYPIMEWKEGMNPKILQAKLRAELNSSRNYDKDSDCEGEGEKEDAEVDQKKEEIEEEDDKREEDDEDEGREEDDEDEEQCNKRSKFVDFGDDNADSAKEEEEEGGRDDSSNLNSPVKSILTFNEAFDDVPMNICDRISQSVILESNPNSRADVEGDKNSPSSKKDSELDQIPECTSEMLEDDIDESSMDPQEVVRMKLRKRESRLNEIEDEDKTACELAGISLLRGRHRLHSTLTTSQPKDKMIRVVLRPDGNYFQVCEIEEDIDDDEEIPSSAQDVKSKVDSVPSGDLDIADNLIPVKENENEIDIARFSWEINETPKNKKYTRVLIPLVKCLANSLSVDAMVNEKGCDSFIQFDMYSKFWRLQDYFRNPTRVTNKDIWPDFTNCINITVTLFESYFLKDEPNSKDFMKDFFPKYLTSEKLLNLQLNDINFRMTILTQVLIIFQYIVADVKFKSEENQPNTVQKTWITRKTHHINQLIIKSSKSGASYSEFLKQVITQEETWNEWKNNGCLPYIVEPQEIINLWVKDDEVDIPACLQVPSIYQESNIDLFTLCEDRKAIPHPKPYFQTTIAQCEPRSGVEQQYKNLTNEVFLWKALRVLSRQDVNYFGLPIYDENKKSLSLDTVAERIIMKSYSDKVHLKREGEDINEDSDSLMNGSKRSKTIENDDDGVDVDDASDGDDDDDDVDDDDDDADDDVDMKQDRCGGGGGDASSAIKEVDKKEEEIEEPGSAVHEEEDKLEITSETLGEIDSPKSAKTTTPTAKVEPVKNVTPKTVNGKPEHIPNKQLADKNDSKNGTKNGIVAKKEANGVKSSAFKFGVRLNIKRGTRLTDNTAYDDYTLVKDQLTKISQLVCADRALNWMDIANSIKSNIVNPNDFKDKNTGLLLFLYAMLEKSPENLTVKKLKISFTKNSRINILEKSLLSFV